MGANGVHRGLRERRTVQAGIRSAHAGIREVLKRRGLTLIEVLVVVFIVALLLAILAPSLSRLRSGAKSIKCMTNLRVIARDFQMFAEETSGIDLPGSQISTQFRMESFAEKEYRISDYWEGPAHATEMQPSTDPMICPLSELPLQRVPARRCEDGAILPHENVSYAFNRRLHEQTIEFEGRYLPDRNTRMHPRILERSFVPLAFDVDGEAASAQDRRPYFIAPSIPGWDDLYSDGGWWYPSFRHRKSMNVAFIGGQVLSSPSPLTERDWDWAYQPNPLRQP